MMQPASAWVWRCLTVASLCATFAVDCFTPPGIAIGMLYVLVLLFAWMAGSPGFIRAVALMAAVLTVLGAFVSAPALGSGPDSLVWTNRIFSLLSIGVAMAFTLEQLKKYSSALETGALLARTKIELEENQRLLQVASETGEIGGWEAQLPQARILWSNEVARIHGKPSGYSPSLQEALDFYTPDCRERIARAFSDCARDGTPFSEVLQLAVPQGSQALWVRATGNASIGAGGSIARVQGALQDISKAKATELKLARLSRVHAMLNEINTAILHIQDRQTLFNTACRIAVESCGFRAAWIGMSDKASQSAVPAASAGFLDGFLDSVRTSHASGEADGHGPFGTAIRENRIVVCNDTAGDPGFRPWREPALARGFRSAAVFPMQLDREDRSAFVLYSEEAGFFDAEEVDLLGNLTANISNASAQMAKEVDRHKPGHVLEESEDRFRAVFNQAAVGICLVSADYRFVRVNQQFCTILGYSAEELTGSQNCIDTTHPDDREADARAVAQLLAGASDVMLEKRYLRKDGSIVWVQMSLSMLHDRSDQTRFAAVISDISEQKVGREKIRQQQSLVRVAAQVSRLGAWHVELPSLALTCSDELRAIAELGAERVLTARNVSAFYHPDDRQLARTAFRQCAKEGLPYDIELRFITTSGKELCTRTIGECVRDAHGQITAVQGAFQDITEHKQAEAAAVQGLMRFRQLADAMPIFVWTCDSTGQVDFLTRALAAYSGLTESQFCASGWPQVIHPDDLDRYALAREASNHTGETQGIELRLRRWDGVYRWHLMRAVATRDESGAIVKWYGSATDVEDQKLTEQRSHDLAARLTSTLESITDAFFTVGPDWSFTYLNSEAEHLLQRSRADLIGKSLWDEFPGVLSTPFEHQYRRAMQEKTSGSFEDFYRPLALWVEVHVYPSAEGMAIYMRDVSKRRASDDQLRLLESAIARLSDIVIITEAEPISAPGPRIVFVNDAFERRTGYLRAEVLGQSPRILQGPNTQRVELERIRHALAHWQPVRAELLNYTKTGEEFWIELDIVPIADERGWYTHWVAVERDVTERRKLQEQLRRSQQLESVGQLTGGLAHDFNNLLTVIMGNAELLSERLGDTRHAPMAQMIIEAAQRGADLTHSLLAFARRQPLEPELTDINRLVEGMDALLRRTLGEHIRIELVRSPLLWNTLVDPSQLESALLNLCINSRDAMPGGGLITVETSNMQFDQELAAQHGDMQPGQYVMLAVSDSGTGIAQEHIEQVFEPFFTTKDTGKGTGLGLSMVYGFVKQSRGHISIHSEPGHGTTVKLFLARALDDIRVVEARAEARALPGSETVLLVEDDPLVRRYVVEQLTELGYRVSQAENGPMALEILGRRDDIDLLFTDVVMPGGMNGRKLADAARALHPRLKVLYTSGYTDDAIVHHGRVDTDVHLLTKPYRRADLARMLRIAIETDPEGLA